MIDLSCLKMPSAGDPGKLLKFVHACNKQLGQYFALKSRTCINQSRSLLAAFGADMSCAEPQFETHLDCVALCMMDTSNDESFL